MRWLIRSRCRQRIDLQLHEGRSTNQDHHPGTDMDVEARNHVVGHKSRGRDCKVTQELAAHGPCFFCLSRATGLNSAWLGAYGARL